VTILPVQNSCAIHREHNGKQFMPGLNHHQKFFLCFTFAEKEACRHQRGHPGCGA
jgi:hypothetical protein